MGKKIDWKDLFWAPRLIGSQAGDILRGIGQKRGPVCRELPMEKSRYYDEYPRPQMRRNSFFSLNGEWEIRSADTREQVLAGGDDQTIEVPLPPQSMASGFQGKVGEWLLYEKRFSLPEGFCKDLTLLHFGAVDQIAEVYLNDVFLGRHEGGYHPFSFPIEDHLREENVLRVLVQDALDHRYPYGKQTDTPGGMWYTQVSGIWQSVWLESMPKRHIRSVCCYNYLKEIPGEGKKPYLAIEIDGTEDRYLLAGDDRFSKRLLMTVPNGKTEIPWEDLTDFALWTPKKPILHEFSVHILRRDSEKDTAADPAQAEDMRDTVISYFALRIVDIREVQGHKRICLNGKPIFFHGVLDQGYFGTGIFTPFSYVEYERDIKHMKELGFNVLRKHIKIEPDYFYYLCDTLGMMVFQDMVNNGEYSYLGDTVRPTFGSKVRSDVSRSRQKSHGEPGKKESCSSREVRAGAADAETIFLEHGEETVRRLKCFPSVVYYTVFNEGWGQHDSEAITKKLKQIDDSRIYDSASGWFRQRKGTASDVRSEHVYFHKVRPVKDEKPIIISEFGGFARVIGDHCCAPDRVYGYGNCQTKEELTERFCKLYREEILPLIPQGVCGAIYTQVSDVEEEVNGLYTYDRKVCKVTPEELRNVAGELQAAMPTP